MSITTHPVEPERVMAFLDGELSDADACEVSNHVDHCAECAHLAARLGGASQSLRAWKVPPIPTKLEESVTNLAAKAASGRKVGRGDLFIWTSFWTWKHWAAAGGGSMAALLVVVAISLPALHRSLPPANRAQGQAATLMSGYLDNSSPKTRLADRDKIEVEQAPVMQQTQSRVYESGPVGGPMSLSSRRFAADSNSLLRGNGNHLRDSFSRDGQPVNDHQGDVSPAPMIARSVSLAMVVKDFALCRSSLDTILERHHGYPEQLSVRTPENAPRTLQASLRIPAPQLSSAVSDLKALGRVENESQSGEEVTKQHTDLVARLKNSRDTEERFRAILQQRTGKVADVLQVEEEIERVRGDIERMEGERKALEHRVDFATVELEVSEEYKAQLNPPAASVSTRMHNAFVDGYHNASETALGMVLFFAEYGPTFLVWIAVLLLPVVLLWMRYRRALGAVQAANGNLPA